MARSSGNGARSLRNLFDEPETKQEAASRAPPHVIPIDLDPEAPATQPVGTPGVIRLPPAHLDYDVARIRLRQRGSGNGNGRGNGNAVVQTQPLEMNLELPPETRNASVPLQERNSLHDEIVDSSQPSSPLIATRPSEARSRGETSATGSNTGSQNQDSLNSFRDLVLERRSMQPSPRDHYAIARKSSWELEPPIAQGHSAWKFIKAHGQSTLFLLALGSIVGLLETCIDSGIGGFGAAMRIILDKTSDEGYGAQLLSFVAFVFGLTVASAVLTKFVDHKAAGSGIPEMKYILGSDVHKEPHRFLPFSTLFVKVVGLIMMVGSGLPIGREGPFVHIAGLVANQLLRLPYFHETNLSGGVKRQLFAAACAVGVSTSFAAPVGGVLFSIEINNTYYLVSNYWKSFLAAICAATAAQLAAWTRKSQSEALSPFVDAPVSRNDTSILEYLIALLLGIVLGVAGIGMVKWQMIWKRAFVSINRKLPIVGAAAVALVSAVFFFVTGPFNRQGFFALLKQLLGVASLPDSWDYISKYYSLSIFTISRALLGAFTTALAVPAGDFVPQFLVGAALGRLLGEGLNDAFPAYGFSPAGYAILCATGFTASTTQTLSTAVIAMEMTGTLGLHLPLLIVALVASGVSKMIGKSIYDEMIQLKGYKALPLLSADAHLRQTAKQVMNDDVKFLATQTTIRKIVDLLGSVKFQAIPVVDDEQKRQFLGCVSRKHLIDFVYRKFYERHGEDILKQALPNEYRTVDSVRARRLNLRRRIPWMLKPNSDLESDASGHSSKTYRLGSAVEALMTEEVDLTQHEEVPIDVSPFRISGLMPMEQIYVLFAMLRCSRVFVTDYNTLVGVITQDVLIDKLTSTPRERTSTVEFVPAHVNAGTIAHTIVVPRGAPIPVEHDRMPSFSHLQMPADPTTFVRPQRTTRPPLGDDGEGHGTIEMHSP